MEHVTIEILLWIIGAAIFSLVAQTAWAWRASLLEKLFSLRRDVSTVRQKPIADYVERTPDVIQSAEAGFSEFERLERATLVQSVQGLNEGDLTYSNLIRLDTLARLLAAGHVAESTGIETIWDGTGGLPKVTRGGSAAYTSRCKVMKALAVRYGYKPKEADQKPLPDAVRVVPVRDGKEGYVKF